MQHFVVAKEACFVVTTLRPALPEIKETSELQKVCLNPNSTKLLLYCTSHSLQEFWKSILLDSLMLIQGPVIVNHLLVCKLLILDFLLLQPPG